jgi:4-hydroxyphenylpyruvate dioxygenase
MYSSNNPCGLDGFAFLEFSSPNPLHIHEIFSNMGFSKIATHPQKKLDYWQQNQIHFICNQIENSQAAQHAQIHHAGACAMAFKVPDAKKSFEIALNRGAKAAQQHPIYHLLAIEGIGGSVIYFVDNQFKPYEDDWDIEMHMLKKNCGLEYIDHLTHNVYRGQLKKWADFYHQIFNFHEIRNFHIAGKMTGLYSEALESPCGKIKIPLNESKDEKSQIEEFLKKFHGEGIQHIALHTSNIYKTVNQMKSHHIHFLNTPDTYFEMIQNRLPWHDEPIDELKNRKILIDGGPTPDQGILLQIFTENIFGPVFFEIIQRKGNHGFGEGNFQALFEAIERDQIQRGVL